MNASRRTRFSWGWVALAVVMAIIVIAVLMIPRPVARVQAVPGATYFSGPERVELRVTAATLNDRVIAIGELARNIGREKDVQAGVVQGAGRITLKVLVGVNQNVWRVPFHIAWPQGSAKLELVNWAAVYNTDVNAARTARHLALARLLELCEREETGPLRGRVTIEGK